MPVMNMAEQVATEIKPCYEVAWSTLKQQQQQNLKKKALFDTEKNSCHPPSPPNQTKQAMSKPYAEMSEKAVLIGRWQKGSNCAL